MNILPRVTFYVLILSFVLLTSAIAQVNFTDNEQQFANANPRLSFQDFSSASPPPNLALPCGRVINSSTGFPCFRRGDILEGIGITTFASTGDASAGFLVAGEDFLNINNNPPDILANSNNTDNIQIAFTNDVDAIGLNLGCITFDNDNGCNHIFTLNIYGDGDQLLGSTSVDVTDSTNSFIGIESSEFISRITLEHPSSFKSILNIRFGLQFVRNVPTLSEWGLIALSGFMGTIGLIVIRKRQHIY